MRERGVQGADVRVGRGLRRRASGGDVDILPWRLFIEGLWGGTLVS